VFRTERAPTTEELFSNGPHLATNQFEIGDITLDEETALGVEGAIRFRGENNFLTINGFYTDYLKTVSPSFYLPVKMQNLEALKYKVVLI